MRRFIPVPRLTRCNSFSVSCSTSQFLTTSPALAMYFFCSSVGFFAFVFPIRISFLLHRCNFYTFPTCICSIPRTERTPPFDMAVVTVIKLSTSSCCLVPIIAIEFSPSHYPLRNLSLNSSCPSLSIPSPSMLRL